jgi:hypothetical protein
MIKSCFWAILVVLQYASGERGGGQQPVGERARDDDDSAPTPDVEPQKAQVGGKNRVTTSNSRRWRRSAGVAVTRGKRHHNSPRIVP